jgi:hypothetical protein
MVDRTGGLAWLPKVAAVGGGVFFLLFGLWAMADPTSFFEQLAKFDPYNQHFIQDIGAFQIGLGAVLLLALLRPNAGVLGVALLGVGIGAAAHVVSHLVGRDLGGKPESDIPIFVLTAIVLLVGGLVRSRPSR